MTASLTLRDLRHDLGGAPLLSLPALDLSSGELTVLSGPSGSGKTTLLHLLSGLALPTAGCIDWDGTDLAQLPEAARDRWRRLRAGFVFQDFHLIPELSALENVLVPAWFGARSARPYRARAQDLLAEFGLARGQRVSLMSRGEQQRVALARALLMQPAVIFADEPTASLDAAAGSGVRQAFLDLAHRQSCLVIVASHDPALIAMADRILCLERGQPTEIQ